MTTAPRKTSIEGQPHKLAYITDLEGELLRSKGGGVTPDGGQYTGPGGIPAFRPAAPGVGGAPGTAGSPSGVGGPTGHGPANAANAAAVSANAAAAATANAAAAQAAAMGNTAPGDPANSTSTADPQGHAQSITPYMQALDTAVDPTTTDDSTRSPTLANVNPKLAAVMSKFSNEVGKVSQANVSNPDTAFGSPMGFVDTATGNEFSLSDVAAMDPATFSAFSNNPNVSSIGDPSTSFGKAVTGLSKAVFGLTNPLGLLGDVALSGLFSATDGNDSSFSAESSPTSLAGLIGNVLGNQFSGFAGTSNGAGNAGAAAGAGGPALDRQAPAQASPQQLLEIIRNTILSPEDRQAAIAQLLGTLTSGDNVGRNPFAGNAGIAEFADVISRGLGRTDATLGTDPTAGQFDNTFSNPTLLDNILSDETNIRQDAFRGEVDNIFTGDAFSAIDDNIINSIVEERSAPARQQVANFQARGNFNNTGGKSANDVLSQQEAGVRNELSSLSDSLLGGNQRDIDQIGNEARSSISGFSLGDDAFDIEPFSTRRDNAISARETSFDSDLRGLIGSDPLFDIGGALSAGRRSQGVVSGAPTNNNSLLDTLAARGSESGRIRRGTSSRRTGSGAF